MTECSKTKLAMFDLDGTLFDTRQTNYLSYRDAFLPFGVDLNYQHFAKYCNGRHYKVFVPELLRQAGNNEAVIDNITEQVHICKKQQYSKYLSNATINVHLFEIIQCLRKQYITAIVTTASRANCLELLTHFKKQMMFDLIITAEDVTKKKPDPEGFIAAMKHFDISSDNAIIFEDSDVGIQAAELCGATVFAVRGFA